MTTEIADLIADADKVATDQPTAEYHALLSTITPAGLPRAVPPRSTPTPLELHQRGAL